MALPSAVNQNGDISYISVYKRGNEKVLAVYFGFRIALESAQHDRHLNNAAKRVSQKKTRGPLLKTVVWY